MQTTGPQHRAPNFRLWPTAARQNVVVVVD